MINNCLKYAKNLNATFNNNQVGYIIFYVTNVCNFRCKFCFYYAEIEKGRKPQQLTLDQIDKISRSTGSLIQLSLTGGEPFLRKDFADLTDIWIKNTGVRFITIPTNGSLKARMLAYFNHLLPKHPNTYFRLAFSIDGINEEHDTNRSMPGSFSKIKDCYKEISELRRKFKNLVIDSNTVFTSATSGKMIKILDYLNKNFEFDNHTVTYARGNIKDETLKSQAAKEYKEMNSFLENLEKRKETRLLSPVYRAVTDISRTNLIETVFNDRFVTPCVAGKKLIVINEVGEVHPCEILNKPLGHLSDYNFDLKKLMKDKTQKEVYNWIKKTKCKCSFECAQAANVTWNWSQYHKILKKSLMFSFKK